MALTTAARARRANVSCSRLITQPQPSAAMSNRDAAAMVAPAATIAARRALRCSFWEKGWPRYGDPFLNGEWQTGGRDLARRDGEAKKVVKSPIVGNRREHGADEPADQARAHPHHVLTKSFRIFNAFVAGREPRQRVAHAALRRDGGGCRGENEERERQQPEEAGFRRDLDQHVVRLEPALLAFGRVVVFELADADARHR